MTRAIAAGTMLALSVVDWARAAEPVVYTWTGMGIGVEGTSKCATYQMTVEVTVDGRTVKGLIKQQGREQRTFQATLGNDGVFKTKAVVGGGNTLDVSGTISDKESRLLMDGYCKFEGRLTPK